MADGSVFVVAPLQLVYVGKTVRSLRLSKQLNTIKHDLNEKSPFQMSKQKSNSLRIKYNNSNERKFEVTSAADSQ